MCIATLDIYNTTYYNVESDNCRATNIILPKKVAHHCEKIEHFPSASADLFRFSNRLPDCHRSHDTAQKRLHGMALPLQLRKRDSAGYTVSSARHHNRLRLYFRYLPPPGAPGRHPDPGAEGPDRTQFRPPYLPLSHHAAGKKRRCPLELPVQLRQYLYSPQYTAPQRKQEKLRLSVSPGEKGFQRKAVWKPHRYRVCPQT